MAKGGKPGKSTASPRVITEPRKDAALTTTRPAVGLHKDLRAADTSIRTHDMTIKVVQGFLRSSGNTTAGLVSYWPFTDNSGSTVTDTQSAHNMTLEDPNNWGTNQYNFNGSTDRASLSDHADFNVGSALTVIIWASMTAADSQTLFAQYDLGNNQRAWSIGTDLTNGDNLRVQISSDGTSGTDKFLQYQGSQLAFDSTWRSVGFRFNAGTLDLFVNGAKDTSVDKTIDSALVTSIHNSTAALTVGHVLNNGSPASAGAVFSARKWRVYNTAKTDADILAIHNLG